MSLYKEAIVLNGAVIIPNSVPKYDFHNKSWRQDSLEIQRLLEGYSNYLDERISNLMCWVYYQMASETYGAENPYHNWLIEIKKVKEGFHKQGLTIINGIIAELGKRRLSKEDSKLLKDIILNQVDIANKILNSELNIIFLENMVAFIKDAPVYLKVDLAVDSLSYQSQKTEVKINEHNYYVQHQKYKLNDSGYYNIA
ncbi:hypothetical protein [Paenibacillus sp. YYML68]|uniref:hypothetical protein n=1 Tax=Paenibacillus sp. YYML68 TaxID=2909250 RepID=UPI0024928D13|nr:hypothetical protein [Paenibacillus sp. YYML68]